MLDQRVKSDRGRGYRTGAEPPEATTDDGGSDESGIDRGTASTTRMDRTVRTSSMSVSIDAFESGDSLDEPPIGERVVAYLAANSDKAFKRGEIAAAIDADPNAVGSALTRLKSRGLVRHREQYWAITDDRELLHETYDLRRLLEDLAADEDEAFDREGWLTDARPVEGYREEDASEDESD